MTWIKAYMGAASILFLSSGKWSNRDEDLAHADVLRSSRWPWGLLPMTLILYIAAGIVFGLIVVDVLLYAMLMWAHSAEKGRVAV